MSVRPKLLAAEPQLFVSDMAAACAFFTGKLGFEVAFLYGEPPCYGQVRRDGAALNLRCVSSPVLDPVRRAGEELLSAAITLASADDIRQLYAEYQAAGISFSHPLETKAWGAQNFIVADPDGNLLLFAGPAA
jgi:catechol 2,3-dioxygenase-like lactoylglutathione lyase family enzyme